MYYVQIENVIPYHLLQVNNYDDFMKLWEFINVNRWNEQASNQEQLLANLTEKEKQEYKEANKLFDLLFDFDAYYGDFLEYYNIDLLTDNIPYFKFIFLLERLFHKEKSEIAQRVQYRSYKADKHDSKDYIKYMKYNKRKYALSEFQSNDWKIIKDMEGVI